MRLSNTDYYYYYASIQMPLFAFDKWLWVLCSILFCTIMTRFACATIDLILTSKNFGLVMPRQRQDENKSRTGEKVFALIFI